MGVPTRDCTICCEPKPLSRKYWRKQGNHFSRQCRQCTNAKSRQYWAENRDHLIAKGKERRAINKAADPDYDRRKAMKRRYGISLEESQSLLEAQGSRCAACERPIAGRDAHLDHDHQTQKIRGYLCSGCNLALGQVNDDPGQLAGLLAYALKHYDG